MDRREALARPTAADALPVLAFAGLWDKWKDAATGEAVRSATIVVPGANAWMVPYHDRMPVLLTADQVEPWLTGKAWAGDVAARGRGGLARMDRLEPG